MLIESVEIKNFRCIKDAKLDCDNLTAIIGRNGAGKSAFLYALDTFYDVAANIKDEDFFNRNITSTIEIRVTYKQLTEEEKLEFQTYLKDEKLIVTKKIGLDSGKLNQKYYGAALQIPQFAEIRKTTGKSEKKEKWNELLAANELPELSGTVRSADLIEPIMLDYEQQHPELKIPIEKELQFFGASSIGGGKLDKYTRFVLVPAVKDASEETSGKRGAIYQLINMIILRKVNARTDIQDFKTEFENRIKQVYSSENLTELPELGKSISEALQVFAPGSELKLKWDEVKAPEVTLPSALATLFEDGFEGEISRKGHGLQRALIITLLQQLALTEQTETLDEENTLSSVTPNLILAIEEPELYLHPSREKYLSNLFLELSTTQTDGRIRNQIIYATHSPYFIDLNRFDQIRCVRKNIDENDGIKHSVISKYTLRQAKDEIIRISNLPPGQVTVEGFKARAVPIMNVIVNEGFFADRILVVEGLGDIGIFWKLQEILGLEWLKKGISIIPALCKNNIDRPVIIFRGLSIPTYFVFDGDITSRNRNSSIETNRRYLRLANTDETDFPETYVCNSWAVFKDKIETEMKEAIGEDIFNELTDVIKEELCYEERKNVFKNIEGASRFIELVYERDLRIPVLEEIITKVEQMN